MWKFIVLVSAFVAISQTSILPEVCLPVTFNEVNGFCNSVARGGASHQTDYFIGKYLPAAEIIAQQLWPKIFWKGEIVASAANFNVCYGCMDALKHMMCSSLSPKCGFTNCIIENALDISICGWNGPTCSSTCSGDDKKRGEPNQRKSSYHIPQNFGNFDEKSDKKSPNFDKIPKTKKNENSNSKNKRDEPTSDLLRGLQALREAGIVFPNSFITTSLDFLRGLEEFQTGGISSVVPNIPLPQGFQTAASTVDSVLEEMMPDFSDEVDCALCQMNCVANSFKSNCGQYMMGQTMCAEFLSICTCRATSDDYKKRSEPENNGDNNEERDTLPSGIPSLPVLISAICSTFPNNGYYISFPDGLSCKGNEDWCPNDDLLNPDPLVFIDDLERILGIPPDLIPPLGSIPGFTRDDQSQDSQQQTQQNQHQHTVRPGVLQINKHLSLVIPSSVTFSNISDPLLIHY